MKCIISEDFKEFLEDILFVLKSGVNGWRSFYCLHQNGANLRHLMQTIGDGLKNYFIEAIYDKLHDSESLIIG